MQVCGADSHTPFGGEEGTQFLPNYLAAVIKALEEFPLKESLHSGDFSPRDFSRGNN